MILAVLVSLLPAYAGTRPTGVPTPIEDPDHAGLRAWYGALDVAAAGKGQAHALHYGDSTIIADGFTRTVRDRLVARFGSAGPGFVTAAFDPAAHQRSDIVSRRSGSWRLLTLLFGGASGRYGLGGIVAILHDRASVTLHAIDAAGAAAPQDHLQVWYQAGVGYGTLRVEVDGVEVAAQPAVATATEDRIFRWDVPSMREIRVGARDGTVPLYGIVLETAASGVSWEPLGVLGVGSKSFTTFAGPTLATQMGWRDPDLVVVMLGGNEASYPVLTTRGGEGYAPMFGAALETLRAGASDASCLVLSPVDQGAVDEVTGTASSRPGMKNLVAMQRKVALASGCAFWSTWGAMGGEGSSVRWAHAGGLGTGDYVHLTSRGLDLLGDLFADAMLGDYEGWRRGE